MKLQISGDIKMLKTYNDVYIETYKKMCDIDRDTAHFEAREIVCAAYHKRKEDWFLYSSMYCVEYDPILIDDIIAKRAKNMPLAYILSEWDFYGRTFHITQDVLIPRPETEILAGKALEYVNAAVGAASVLDLCCGSGCIGITLALENLYATLTLADISQKALDVSHRNTERYNLSSRVTCRMANAQKEPPEDFQGFDIIVCNPPYITTAEMKTLDRSVRDYEPTLALDGGSDGLSFYRSILEKWAHTLSSSGRILFEVGMGQADSVVELMAAAEFTELEILSDYNGIDRVVCGKCPNKYWGI